MNAVLAFAGFLVVSALARPSSADEGMFLVKLGRDTTAIERFTRTAGRLEVHQVGRSPRVLHRNAVFTYEGDVLARLDVTVTAPGASAPVQTITGTAEPDSFRVRVRSASGSEQVSAVAFPRGGVAVPYSSPWAAYEGEIIRYIASKSDSVRKPLFYLGASGTNWLTLRRLGRDSVVLANDRNDVFHVRIDRGGHVLGVLPVSGTGMISLERRERLDFDGLAASFAAREQAGGAMGALSPRDTVRADVAGASLWIDYGRPSKRGRVIFGNVVPYGDVWRTGANAATQFRADKALDFGGTVVPAGEYTLWSVITPEGWTLILNSQTGQWGTSHDPAKDVARIALKLETLPTPVERMAIGIDPAAAGGVLRIEWDTKRAVGAFRVMP